MADIREEWLSFYFNTLSFFGEIPESESKKGLAYLKHSHLHKNEYFIRTGDIPDRMAFIAKGIFRVFHTTENGDDKTLVFREEGWMLSAYSSFLENKPAWFNIQALEESDLIYISFDDYSKIMNGHQCWRQINAKYTEMLFVEKEKRESEFLSDDALTRYEKFKLKYPGIENRINQYHIASYLGITPVALSRIRAKIIKDSIS